MSVDGVAAANTLLSWGTCRPGLCLYYVWQAYKAHGASAEGSYPTALDAWHGSPGQHYDRNPPAGVPVYFGAKPTSSAGDVVISLGGGRVAATDWPVYGVIGVTTIAERQAQINRPYLGWTDNILGYPVLQAQPAAEAAEDLIIPEPEVFDMTFSIVPVVGGGIDAFSLTGQGRVRISSPYHVTLLQRARKNNSDDPMLPGELDIVTGYLRAINPPADVKVDAQALADALSKIDAAQDADVIEKAVTAALGAHTKKIAQAIGGAV